jgi:hypothetical protein
LFVAREYDGLVWLSALICGSEVFDPQEPAYGLEPPLFLFVEALAWFAQAIRSGVWTYFETTPVGRQQRMLALLKTIGPSEFGSAMRAPCELGATSEQLRPSTHGSQRTSSETTISCGLSQRKIEG